jgi:tetratricopeptide (TPR) repeat protein
MEVHRSPFEGSGFVISSITRLRPRVGSFEIALEAYRSARFGACLSEIHGLSTFSARLLRARAHLRGGDPASALATLDVDEWGDARDRAERAMLRGVSQSRIGRSDSARDSFTEACVFAITAADTTLEAEIDYYRALASFGEGALGAARGFCGRSAATPWCDASADLRATVPRAHVLSRTQELLGLAEAAEGNYSGWLRLAREALRTLDACAVPDVYAEAHALKNLAVIARDFDVEDVARELARRVPNLAWTPEIARVEFASAETLGWCSALRGDVVEALRLFRRAAAAGTSEPEAILIGVDRAVVARAYGHAPMFAEELEEALALAGRYDWTSAPDDYVTILLPLAQATATLASARARDVLDLYVRVRRVVERTFVARLEPRVRAEEGYTRGLVLRAEGRLAESIGCLREAFDLWKRIGYEWRAARAALELAELDAGDVYRTTVRCELDRRPNSIFSTRARLIA